MDLSKPNKNVFIGGSHTGKSYLFYKLLVGGFLGTCDYSKYLIIVASTLKVSLDQPLWDIIERKGFRVEKILLNRSGSYPKYDELIEEANKDKNILKTIFVCDDTDKLSPCCALWVQNLFSVMSHHQELTIFLILHTYSINSPTIFRSTDHIWLFSIDETYAKKICKEFEINYELYKEVMNSKSNIVEMKDCEKFEDNTYSNFNYIIRRRTNKCQEDGSTLGNHYIVDYDNFKCVCLD